MIYIFGLGNPGGEYEKSRHNVGREAVKYFARKNDFGEFELDKKSKSFISKNKQANLVLPETFMNKSGLSTSYFIKSSKAAGNLIVIYDDIDLPLGIIKISYNKSSGGHRGLESIIKALKTREFTRIRIGISPASSAKASAGQAKKPQGEQKVLDFILGKFKPSELENLKKIFKKVAEAIETVVEEGRDRAMNEFN